MRNQVESDRNFSRFSEIDPEPICILIVTRENLDFQAVPKQRKRFGKQVIDAGNNHISTPCWIMMGLADVNSMYRFRMFE